MIASLKGRVASLESDYLILEVGGVGYKIESFAPFRLGREGVDAHVYTYTFVRETELRLIGFASKPELQLFESLLKVSGVGPKTAMQVLAAYSVAQIRGAIENQDAGALKIKGVGSKTVAKILIELKGRLGDIASGDSQDVSKDTTAQLSLESASDLELALLGLGYTATEIKEVITVNNQELPFSDQLKIALAKLSQ